SAFCSLWSGVILDRISKAHYPAEYMAALLTSVSHDKDKLALYLNECRHMDITLLPPDINESTQNFTPVGNDIRIGLVTVRNVGAHVFSGMVKAREEQGASKTAQDFS